MYASGTCCCASAAHKLGCSTESNALTKSMAANHNSVFHSLDFSMTIVAANMWSTVEYFFLKPAWSQLCSGSRNFSSLTPTMIENTLYKMGNMEIGL